MDVCLKKQSKGRCTWRQNTHTHKHKTKKTHIAMNGGMFAKTIETPMSIHKTTQKNKTKTHIAMNAGLSAKTIKKLMHIA